MQLVAESGMDLEKALAEFKEAKADGEIPPEAYGEAWRAQAWEKHIQGSSHFSNTAFKIA